MCNGEFGKRSVRRRVREVEFGGKGEMGFWSRLAMWERLRHRNC